MTIKFVKISEYDRIKYIMRYCFPWLHEDSDSSVSSKAEHIKPEAFLGFYDEKDELKAFAENVPFKIMIDGVPMDMGGIAGVSSLPEVRHGGHVAEILKRWLEIMKVHGQTLSMLGPFSYEFYRKYGWELGFERMNYSVPIEHLNGFKHKTGNIRPVNKEDIDKLDEIYMIYAKTHNGCAVRDKTLWSDFVLSDPFIGKYERYAYLWFYGDDTPGGYIIYTVKDGKMNIYEMIYKDSEAEESLLGFIYSHQSQISQVEWSTATDEPLRMMLPNPRIEMKLVPSMMFRVVDVENALVKRRYPSNVDIAFDIEISDPIAPWNQRPWHVHVSSGLAKVEKAISAAVRCDVQTFSQIFLGYISVNDAERLGKIEGERQILESMGHLFKPSITFNNNGF